MFRLLSISHAVCLMICGLIRCFNLHPSDHLVKYIITIRHVIIHPLSRNRLIRIRVVGLMYKTTDYFKIADLMFICLFYFYLFTLGGGIAYVFICSFAMTTIMTIRYSSSWTFHFRYYTQEHFSYWLTKRCSHLDTLVNNWYYHTFADIVCIGAVV